MGKHEYKKIFFLKALHIIAESILAISPNTIRRDFLRMHQLVATYVL
jgi:hypothetical protein